MSTNLQPGARQPTDRNTYWMKTSFRTAIGGGVGLAVGIVAGVVFALIKLHEMSSLHSETVPTAFWVPLFMIGIASEGALAGGAAGMAVGFLWPVSGGPPFLTAQLPLKLLVLGLVSVFVYLGLVGRRHAQQRREEAFRSAPPQPEASEVRKSIEKEATRDIPGDGTGLFLAAWQGNLAMCRSLLSQGADVNKKTLQGETALLAALQNVHPDVARALVDAGADVNLSDATGQTPLILAAKLDDTNLIEALLAKGADINYVVLYGSYSPLIAAVTYHRAKNVELLLRSGADPNLSPRGAPSPLATARRIGDQPIVDLLIAHGAK